MISLETTINVIFMKRVDDLQDDPYKGRIVVGVIIYVFDEDGHVLLFRRKNPPFAGYWEAPGGKVMFLESLKSAAIRELREETGIEAREDELLFVDLMEHIIEPDYHRVLVSYAVKVHGNIEIRLSEHDEYGWFSMDNLPEKLLAGPIHKAYKIIFGDVSAQETQG